MSNVTSIGLNKCYYMFYNCTSLTTPPDMSNVTSISNDGCTSMFYNCMALTSTPKINCKNITLFGFRAFVQMFKNCVNLKTINIDFDFDTSIVKSGNSTSGYTYSYKEWNVTTDRYEESTNIQNYITFFSEMFSGCTTLEDISNIKIPYLIPKDVNSDRTAPCEFGMFINCTSLKGNVNLIKLGIDSSLHFTPMIKQNFLHTNIEKITIDFGENVYNGKLLMSENFYYCENLNTVILKGNFTNAKFNSIVEGAKPNGTLYNLTNVPISISSPEGWTVVDTLN